MSGVTLEEAIKSTQLIAIPTSRIMRFASTRKLPYILKPINSYFNLLKILKYSYVANFNRRLWKNVLNFSKFDLNVIEANVNIAINRRKQISAHVIR